MNWLSVGSSFLGCLFLISTGFCAHPDGELFYVVQFRKSAPTAISTIKSSSKKSKALFTPAEHFHRTNFDISNSLTAHSSMTRLKVFLNRDFIDSDIGNLNGTVPIENCFYYGSVQKSQIMTIALSTCGSHIGLEGLLIRNNDTLWISPERAHPFDSMLMDRAAKTEGEDYYSNNEFTNDKIENVTPSPHRIRLYDHFRLSYSKCATSEALSFTQVAEIESPHIPPFVERLSSHMQEHQLHMTVMLDLPLIDNFFDGNLQMASSAILSAMNIADLVSRRFGLHLIVSSVGIWEQNVPSSLSKFSSTSSRWNIHQLMTYNRWRYQNSTVEPFHPMLVVFSGVATSKPKGIPLDATVPHSVCSKEVFRSVIFVAAEKGLPTPVVFDLASSFLHQIGHALGFAEDSCNSLSCSSAWCSLANAENGDVRSLIAPLLNCPMRSDNLHLKPNLNCLLPSFKTNVQKSLLGVEQANAEWKLTDNTQENHRYMNQKYANGNQGRCGDGYIDATEECDCEVKNGECVFDVCCDPKLCILHKWAQCSSSDLCCSKNCTLKPAETVCRPALSECDFPEQCTGLNGKCPTNHLIADGFSCLDPSRLQPQIPNYGSSDEFSFGICFAGLCRSRDVACRALWGPSGKSAPAKCYEAMCNGCENMYCDQLQCQAEDSSVALTNSTFVISQVHLEQNQVVNCRHFISQSSERDIVKVGSVPDWSPCGSGKICHGGHCVDMSNFNTANCPLGNSRVFVGENPNLAQNDIACSGNGWCVNSSSSTSMGKCICKPFWSGSACEVFINDTQIWPLFKNYSEPLLIYSSFFANFSNRALLTAVVPVVGCILIAFLFFVICYRRKLIVIKPKRKRRKRQQSFRRNSRNLSKTSLKGLPQLARTDTDDSRIASPVILCTTNSTYSVKNEFGAEEHQEMEVVQTHPLLTKQPEKGILKKKMTSTDSNVSNDSTLQSNSNNNGICKVDANQASLQMEAMMHNFKMNGNLENSSVSEAFRNLAHHFNPTQQQQQHNDWNGSSSQFDLVNQRLPQIQPHQGSSENNSDGENTELELTEGVMQLASLRQIVSMRRNSGAPSINDYHPPDQQFHGSDSPHRLGKNEPAIVKPDVISTCSPSRFMANVSSVAATINTSARPESCENRDQSVETPLEQILNHIEQKFINNAIGETGIMSSGSSTVIPTASNETPDFAVVKPPPPPTSTSGNVIQSDGALADESSGYFPHHNQQNHNHFDHFYTFTTASTSISSAVYGGGINSPSIESSKPTSSINNSTNPEPFV